MKMFPEPSRVDDTPAHDGESNLDWLARSTWVRARECRRFLNENFSRFSSDTQQCLFHALRRNWESGFFELIVGRTLQELGAEVEYEPESMDGSRTDFLARFKDGVMLVECVAPEINREATQKTLAASSLIKIVEECLPEGWLVMVRELPLIGPAESKQKFQTVIKELLNVPPPATEEQWVDLVRQFGTGTISISLLAANTERTRNRVSSRPAVAYYDDSESRIIHAFRKKRSSKASDAQVPLVLAIQGDTFNSGASSYERTFEMFDMALFGRTTATVDTQGRILSRGFDPSGQLASERSTEPRISGVLAFVGVQFLVCPQPVLYVHPRRTKTIPEAMFQIECRELINRSRVNVMPPVKTDVMNRLSFVDPKVD